MESNSKEKSRVLESVNVRIVGDGFILSKSFRIELKSGGDDWKEDIHVYTDKKKLMGAFVEALGE